MEKRQNDKDNEIQNLTGDDDDDDLKRNIKELKIKDDDSQTIIKYLKQQDDDIW